MSIDEREKKSFLKMDTGFGAKIKPMEVSSSKDDTKSNPTMGILSKQRNQIFTSSFGATVSPTVALKMEEKVYGADEVESISLEQIRLKVKKIFSHSMFGKFYEDIQLAISLFSCVLFISETYYHDKISIQRFDALDKLLAVIFMFDWTLSFFLADHKIAYCSSFFSIVDILSVVSIFLTSDLPSPSVYSVHSVHETFMYIVFAFRRTRILRALRLYKKLLLIDDAVQRCVGEITLNILVMILFNAAVIQFLEEADNPMPFHDWMYYMWVTIATVGYGDITPRSTLGRFSAMAMIGFAIISVPQMTNELIEKMNLQSIYARASYRPKGSQSKHVIICGDLRSTSLSELFSELFHEDHENLDLSAVILQPEPPSFDLLMLLRDPMLALSVIYLEGSALLEFDLRRARADIAVAVFIMTNKFSSNPDEEDSKTILQEFSIKRFLSQFQEQQNSRFLYCLQLIRPENRRHLSSHDNDHSEQDIIICLNEIKMGVLAKAIMFPGTNTLIMNLITSFADEDDEDDESGKEDKDDDEDEDEDDNDNNAKTHDNDDNEDNEDVDDENDQSKGDVNLNEGSNKNKNGGLNKNASRGKLDTLSNGSSSSNANISTLHWLHEYQKGCDWEIYTTELSSMFKGAKFTELSHLLYQKLGVVLFALQIYDRKDTSEPPRMLLNPENYFIPDKKDFKVEAFVIAKNKAASDLTFPNSESERSAGFSLSPTSAVIHQRLAQFRRDDGDTEASDVSSGKGGVESLDGSSQGDLSLTSATGNGTFGRRLSRLSALSTNIANNLVNKPPKRQGLAASPWKLLKRSSVIRKKVECDTEQEQIQKLEDEHFAKHYFIRTTPIELKDITVRTSLTIEYPLINNHIIIMGKSLSNLYDLIRPLRAKYLGIVRHIVILYPQDIPHAVWQRISIFEAILFVRGSPLEENDIRRAGIFRAAHVVVLADSTTDSKNYDSHNKISSASQESLVDSDAIFSFQCVKRLNQQAHVVVEIVRQSNIGYLDSEPRNAMNVSNGTSNNSANSINSSTESISKSLTEDYKFTSQFASGALFTTSLLDTLVCQAFYNPQIIKVVNKLVSGIDQVDRAEFIAQVAKRDNDEGLKKENTNGSALSRIQGSALYQISVPEGCKTYGALFKHLAAKGTLPLGILRGTFSKLRLGPRGNKTSYVFTNPDPKTELFVCDKVFVLSPTPIQATRGVKDWLTEARRSMIRNNTKANFSVLYQNRFGDHSATTSDSADSSDSIKQLERRVDQLSQSVNSMFSEILARMNSNGNSNAINNSSGRTSNSSTSRSDQMCDTSDIDSSSGGKVLYPKKFESMAASNSSSVGGYNIGNSYTNLNNPIGVNRAGTGIVKDGFSNNIGAGQISKKFNNVSISSMMATSIQENDSLCSDDDNLNENSVENSIENSAKNNDDDDNDNDTTTENDSLAQESLSDVAYLTPSEIAKRMQNKNNKAGGIAVIATPITSQKSNTSTVTSANDNSTSLKSATTSSEVEPDRKSRKSVIVSTTNTSSSGNNNNNANSGTSSISGKRLSVVSANNNGSNSSEANNNANGNATSTSGKRLSVVSTNQNNANNNNNNNTGSTSNGSNSARGRRQSNANKSPKANETKSGYNSSDTETELSRTEYTTGGNLAGPQITAMSPAKPKKLVVKKTQNNGKMTYRQKKIDYDESEGDNDVDQYTNYYSNMNNSIVGGDSMEEGTIEDDSIFLERQQLLQEQEEN